MVSPFRLHAAATAAGKKDEKDGPFAMQPQSPTLSFAVLVLWFVSMFVILFRYG